MIVLLLKGMSAEGIAFGLMIGDLYGDPEEVNRKDTARSEGTGGDGMGWILGCRLPESLGLPKWQERLGRLKQMPEWSIGQE